MSKQTLIEAANELADGEARRFEIDGHRIAVVRVGDSFHAIGDRCSHANFSLSEGDVDCDDLTVECWKHGALFSLATGEALTLPALKSVPVYPVSVTDGGVFVALPGEDNA